MALQTYVLRSTPLRFIHDSSSHYTIFFIVQHFSTQPLNNLGSSNSSSEFSSRSTCFNLTTYFRTFQFSFRISAAQIFGKGMRGEREHLLYIHRHFSCLVVHGNSSGGKLEFADKFDGGGGGERRRPPPHTPPPSFPPSSTSRNINRSEGRCGNEW